MKKIIINSTEVYVGNCIELNSLIPDAENILLVTDSNVQELYARKIKHTLLYSIKPGEDSKNTKNYYDIINLLAGHNYTRDDVLVALGGGVVTDLAGFAASTYKRGINFISIPTSLLGMIDASIGGKNGINLKEGKNLVGTFYDADRTIVDIDFLNTLDVKEIRNGTAEMIKYAAVCDKSLFRNLQISETAIRRCIEIKKEFVEKDYYDLGNRKALNFGHTIGHAIETDSKYKIKHGEAIAMGMVMITELSEKMGLSKEGTVLELKKKLDRFGLKTSYNKSIGELMPYIKQDKKVKDNNTIDLTIIPEIGSYKIVNLNLGLLK